jgi:hypothetical protein
MFLVDALSQSALQRQYWADFPMKPLLLLSALALLTAPVPATDSYEYKPGEYLLINHGLSPNKKYGLYAGETDNFHVFLFAMEGKSKRMIGPLTEIEAQLDTGAQAYRAEWSPDSRHVAVTYRADRHWLVMQLYHIENRRATPMEYPDLFDTAVPHFDAKAHEMENESQSETIVKWKSATQFVLTYTRNNYHVHHSPQQELGKFAKVENGGDSNDKDDLEVHFSAEALCELNDKDEIKILDLKPGKFLAE